MASLSTIWRGSGEATTPQVFAVTLHMPAVGRFQLRLFFWRIDRTNKFSGAIKRRDRLLRQQFIVNTVGPGGIFGVQRSGSGPTYNPIMPRVSATSTSNG